MIEIKGLMKSFNDERVLFANFNLKIETGEFVVFVGKSGSGKTTLLNMIGSLERFDSGQIIVDGVNIAKRRNQLNYLRRKVGFLFQNFALIEEKTVIENLRMVDVKYRGKTKINAALSELGLSDLRDKKVYTLSGGEQQRVALARLIIKECDIILADEPTGSLDPENANTVIENLKKLNGDDKTVLMVTHTQEYKKLGRVVEIS